jgi:hypothetical protein
MISWILFQSISGGFMMCALVQGLGFRVQGLGFKVEFLIMIVLSLIP